FVETEERDFDAARSRSARAEKLVAQRAPWPPFCGEPWRRMRSSLHRLLDGLVDSRAHLPAIGGAEVDFGADAVAIAGPGPNAPAGRAVPAARRARRPRPSPFTITPEARHHAEPPALARFRLRYRARRSARVRRHLRASRRAGRRGPLRPLERKSALLGSG